MHFRSYTERLSEYERAQLRDIAEAVARAEASLARLRPAWYAA